MKKIFLLIFICLQANASIYIAVSGANVKRAKIAIGQVHLLPDATPGDPNLARKVYDQLRTDLEFENIFDFVSDALFTKLDQAKDLYSIKYEEWAPTGASFVLKMGYRMNGPKLFLEAILYDVPGQKKVFGTRYQYPAEQYARLVHTVAEDILRELTGERGLFFSRILMVCRDRKWKKSPPSDIYIVDPDGRNFTRLTTDNTISASPSWMNDGKHIAYTQYEWVFLNGNRKKGTVLKKHDLETGNRKILSSREGMNSGSAWTPKGDRGAVTLSFSGKPEIYLINPAGTGEPEPLSRKIQWKRISGEGFQSSDPSLLFEVEPNWSPDGTKLVFSSARTGKPMIYTVDVATKIANQLTFAGQYNARPSWSPKGDKILFAAQQSGTGNFDLYIIDADGNNLTRLTAGDRSSKKVNSENPSFAPTGRHFTFASNESGEYAIYVMTTDSTQKTRISPPDKICQSPAWGPFEG